MTYRGGCAPTPPLPPALGYELHASQGKRVETCRKRSTSVTFGPAHSAESEGEFPRDRPLRWSWIVNELEEGDAARAGFGRVHTSRTYHHLLLRASLHWNELKYGPTYVPRYVAPTEMVLIACRCANSASARQ